MGINASIVFDRFESVLEKNMGYISGVFLQLDNYLDTEINNRTDSKKTTVNFGCMSQWLDRVDYAAGLRSSISLFLWLDSETRYNQSL
jgi:hypothetical protein